MREKPLSLFALLRFAGLFLSLLPLGPFRFHCQRSCFLRRWSFSSICRFFLNFRPALSRYRFPRYGICYSIARELPLQLTNNRLFALDCQPRTVDPYFFKTRVELWACQIEQNSIKIKDFLKKQLRDWEQKEWIFCCHKPRRETSEGQGTGSLVTRKKYIKKSDVLVSLLQR